jgi:hypothetical protein
MLPVARTRDEAHLYMDLHGCPQCGTVDVDWAEALVDEGGVTGRRYHGVCPGCGARREFVFALPERPTPPRPGEQVTFGAHRDPSVLFDAGQWLAVADMLAFAAGLDVPPEERRESLTIAIACLDEILKFLPDGSDEPPASMFWSDAGRAERDRDPGRFLRESLVRYRADLAGRR